MKRGRHLLGVLVDTVETASIGALLTIIFGLLGAIALVDLVTNQEVSFAPLYILPVLAAAWRFRLRDGLLFSLLCAIVWTTVEFAGGTHATTVIAAWNGFARLLTYALVTMLVTEIRIGYEAQRHAAQHDRLTGLLNGRLFEERLDALVAATVGHGMRAALAYFDLDDFKVVNDTYGHARGDALLERIGRTLAGTAAAQDVAARMGGDEFAVLVRDPCPRALELRLAKLHGAVVGVLDADGSGAGCSMGTARLSPQLHGGRALLAAADGRLYRQKRRNHHRRLTDRLPAVDGPAGGRIADRLPHSLGSDNGHRRFSMPAFDK